MSAADVVPLQPAKLLIVRPRESASRSQTRRPPRFNALMERDIFISPAKSDSLTLRPVAR